MSQKVKAFKKYLYCKCGGLFSIEVDEKTSLYKCDECGEIKHLKIDEIPRVIWEMT
jgi:predicted RNA-binding Zn-ribbon protein involved in translation (DUF1610 family)